MTTITINGGKVLNGEVEAAGNKNAVLKMIPAALLTTEPVILTKVPNISDVDVMLEMARGLGVNVEFDKENAVIRIHAENIAHTKVDQDLAKKLRASNMFIGPLLARMGEVEAVMPGGDKIGPREMNAHFDGLQQLGAQYEIQKNGEFKLWGKLTGANVFLYEPSVTATENTLLAAVTAQGETIIENAACEPHVQELCLMLNSMGASISGIGTNKLIIQGVEKLSGTEYQIPPDHVYVGTMICIAAITGGEMLIKNVNHQDLRIINYSFGKLGVRTEERGNDLYVPANQKLVIEDSNWARTKGIYSQPWPCFPTDLMSPAIVLATQVEGSLTFFEKMFAGRMFFAEYLNGMGANVFIADPYRVVVNGKTKLTGQTMYAPDLRAGMAYIMAGLCAEGETIIHNVEHVYRGYPDIEKVLLSLGAQIVKND